MNGSRPPGTVALVGAGPGDPGLITRRGAELLARADVIIYDNLVNPRLVALGPAGATRIDAGKSARNHTLTQDAINALMVEQARAGRFVVRLKGGDPFIFGRGGEEAEHLFSAGIPFEVVPGVTAAAGASASAGIPITHRDSASAVALVTGHGDPDAGQVDWEALARFPGTLVAYMAVGQLGPMTGALIARGKDPATPAALIEWGTTPRQRVLESTLEHLAEHAASAAIRPPALAVIGSVVLRRDRINWFERRPLFGRRILLTRPEGEADDSARRLESLGAEVFAAPAVRILPLLDYAALDATLNRIESFDWVVFTSSNGVRHFLDRLPAVGRDLRALGRAKLAAIGPTTAQALAEARLNADLIPPSYRSEDLVEALRPLVAGRSVLLARADRGRELLRDGLQPIACVEQVAVYRNVDAEALPPEAHGVAFDWITLTSPAIARRTFDLLDEPARAAVAAGRTRLATLSPVTSAAVRSLGWPVAAEAAEFTFDGLIGALLAAETGWPPDEPS